VRVAALAVALAALAALGLVLSGGSGRLLGGVQNHPAALADAVPYDGRSPVAPAGERVRVLVALPRPALGDLPDAPGMSATAQRAYETSLKHEASALRSALGARGIRLTDVVAFARVWDGFAATARTRDLARLTSLGVRPQPVRRLYPASGEPVPVAAPAGRAGADPAAGGPVAVLDTGVDTAVAPLRGRTVGGYDAVDRDRNPAPGTDPRNTRLRETSGTAVAGVLAAAGERVLPIRVASLRTTPGGAVEAAGTTDQLLAGLERAVDPNGDGNTSDHVPVALVGVNSPYAGFAASPEAHAVAAAGRLGTLVVAPAGEEGAGAGTIGSPGAAPAALTVGALAGPERPPRVALQTGDQRVADAAALAGSPPQAAGLRLAGPVSATEPAALVRAGARLVGRVALVRAGADPGAQAAAAAAAGARAVVLADPRQRPLAAAPAGRVGVPVIGVTGAGARALLGVSAGSAVRFGPVRRVPPADAPAPLQVAPASATGPTAGGVPKPDLAAPGSALTVVPGGARAVTGGTAVAAARVAAAAARLARARPRLDPAGIKAALMASADPDRLPVVRAGAGALRPAAHAAVTADPPAAAGAATLRVRLTASRRIVLRLDAGPHARVRPTTLRLRAGRARTVRLRVAAPGAGRLLVRDSSGSLVAPAPWFARGAVAPVPLGPLATTGGRRVDGVRFALGAFRRGDPLGAGSRTRVAERLVLQLVRADGTPVEALTGPGGARELMPGVYAYRLPRARLAALAAGRYAFRARAWAPGQRKPSEARSAAFTR
jgi:hypothetical protein